VSEILLQVQGIVNQFGTHRVHDGVSFDIQRNEILGIVGGSGSGKSVLFRTLLGLHQPKAGEVIYRNQSLMGLSHRQRSAITRRWGVLFQSGALFSSLTVSENIQLLLKENFQVRPALRKTLAEIKLKMVGLDVDVGARFPAELSGGMVKRVALARALALDPELVFLDEPTSGLDPISAAEFDALLRRLQKDIGLTVIMITHDLDSIFSTCDRLAVLVDKRVITDTVDKIVQHPHPWIVHYFHGVRSRLAVRSGG
jgi:phospholipid/cholesterol/gamma-HCH transport system ATP-binding protein